MALLIFSNSGDWDRDQIGFRAFIPTETDPNWAKGPIALIQEFIKDDGVLDEIYEDEHKSLVVKSVGDYNELFELLDKGEYTLWSDYSDPHWFVNFSTSSGDCEWMYVIYKV
ncbi:MAG: hypothetical protein CTY12_00640 [Methylotenera sp.]|nr:MAG: hypothetical protein CTY12_00640 [Methylotenera sp.]